MAVKKSNIDKLLNSFSDDEIIVADDFNQVISSDEKSYLLSFLDGNFINSLKYYDEGIDKVYELVKWNDWDGVNLLSDALKVYTNKCYHEMLVWFDEPNSSYYDNPITYGYLKNNLRKFNISLDN